MTSRSGDIENKTATGTRPKMGGYLLAWLLIAIAIAVNIAGYYFNWYGHTVFDEAIHGFTFFALTLLIGLYLYGTALTGYSLHKATLVFTVFCVGLSMGVFWEWGEWAYDHLAGPQGTIQGKRHAVRSGDGWPRRVARRIAHACAFEAARGRHKDLTRLADCPKQLQSAGSLINDARSADLFATLA